MIRMNCPHCQKKLGLDDDLAGQVAVCPKCQNEFPVPEEEIPSVEADDESAEPVKKSSSQPAPEGRRRRRREPMSIVEALESMGISGIEGMTDEELTAELDEGARFVYFEYCISIILITFKNPTGIYFIRAGRSGVGKGLGYTAMSLVLGWWGIPWGPIYTIASLVTNFSGGKDVTDEVLAGFR